MRSAARLFLADVVAGSEKKYWFDLCSSRKASFYDRWTASSAGLEKKRPEVAAQWHPTKNGVVTPKDVSSKTNEVYWWWCDAGPDHEWEASPNSRVSQGTGCPCCSGHQVSVTNSLASLAPEVVAQWHPTKNGDLTPADVTSQSEAKR
jgi:hypothetical protein